jgi:hypothetical protein
MRSAWRASDGSQNSFGAFAADIAAGRGQLVDSFAFISFSADDKTTVEALTRTAPKGFFRIYTHDFVDGAALISEMERNVQGCSLFLFLASKKSVASTWCRYEISLAQIETITRDVKVIVLSLDPDVQLGDLPAWMRNYWIPSASTKRPALRRKFLDILENNCLRPQYAGLNARRDAIKEQYYARIAETKEAANVFFFSGVEGIGRQTTARAFLEDLYQNRQFSHGPSISLEDPASIEDFYLRLYENYVGSLVGDSYEKELTAYRSLNVDEQIQRALEVSDGICSDGETIFLRCRSGLFDDDRNLIYWARKFIRGCGERPRIKFVIISNRQPRFSDISEILSMVHFHINPLTASEVDLLVREITLSRDGVVATPSSQARNSIGGHPILARHYAHVISQYGASGEDQAVYDTILQQKNMLTAFLDYDRLTAAERDMLALLSWLPRVPQALFDELCETIGITNVDACLEELVLASLIDYRAGSYAIAGPVRLVFRQMYGDGDKQIGLKVAQVMAGKLGKDDLPTSEIVDTLSFLLLIGGRDLPSDIYSAHARTRKSAGSMTRKLSVTWSQ